MINDSNSRESRAQADLTRDNSRKFFYGYTFECWVRVTEGGTAASWVQGRGW